MPDKFLLIWEQKGKKISIHSYNSFSDRRTVYPLKTGVFSLRKLFFKKKTPNENPHLRKKFHGMLSKASESCWNFLISRNRTSQKLNFKQNRVQSPVLIATGAKGV